MPVLKDNVLFQKDPQVDSYEWQFRASPDEEWQPITGTIVQDTTRCWRPDLDLPEPGDGFVRARGHLGDQVSEWSNTIAVPEPDFSVGLLCAIVFLAWVISGKRL